MFNNINTPSCVKKILINEKRIKRQIVCAGKWIDKNFSGKNPILIAVLKGSVPFYGQLITKISATITLDFIVVSSYSGGLTSAYEPKIVTDTISDMKDKHLILIEDVVDSGKSMAALKQYFFKKGAKTVSIVSLIDKPDNREVDLVVDYSCFVLPANKFIIGYGLDYEEKYRNLPYIAEFNKTCIK